MSYTSTVPNRDKQDKVVVSLIHFLYRLEVAGLKIDSIHYTGLIALNWNSVDLAIPALAIRLALQPMSMNVEYLIGTTYRNHDERVPLGKI